PGLQGRIAIPGGHGARRAAAVLHAVSAVPARPARPHDQRVHGDERLRPVLRVHPQLPGQELSPTAPGECARLSLHGFRPEVESVYTSNRISARLTATRIAAARVPVSTAVAPMRARNRTLTSSPMAAIDSVRSNSPKLASRSESGKDPKRNCSTGNRPSVVAR